MWMLRNRTPYGAERNWVRDKSGAHHWLVAVRATFDIEPGGRVTLADEQPPPTLTPRYHGEPGVSSLYMDSDLLAFKPSTDVLLAAHAYAPKQRSTETVPAALRIGSLEKTILVHGRRVYRRGTFGLSVSRPHPFASAPIDYESAFGGLDSSDPDPRRHGMYDRNPVGRGFALDPRRLEGQPAHAIEYPSGEPASRGPAGFGPIDRWWSPRRELGGTYDERWNAAKNPLLPDDYDDRFALSAPEDQRLPRPLRGGERVSLLNMTPSGSLVFDLPRVAIAEKTWFGRAGREHRTALTTVFIDTEEMKLTMIWQSTLAVPAHAVEYLDLTMIWEKRYLG